MSDWANGTCWQLWVVVVAAAGHEGPPDLLPCHVLAHAACLCRPCSRDCTLHHTVQRCHKLQIIGHASDAAASLTSQHRVTDAALLAKAADVRRALSAALKDPL